MRQLLVVKVDSTDLAAIRRGEPLVIERADGGATISVEYERGTTTAPLTSDNGTPERAPRAAPARTRGRLGGVCPFCKKETGHVKSHIYLKHPGKGLSPTGPKCRYCDKRFPNANSTMRHEVRSHYAEFAGKRVGVKAPPPSKRARGAKAPKAAKEGANA